MKRFLSKSLLGIALLSGISIASCKKNAETQDIDTSINENDELEQVREKESEDVVISLNGGKTSQDVDNPNDDNENNDPVVDQDDDGDDNQQDQGNQGDQEDEIEISTTDFTKLDTIEKVDKYSRQAVLHEEQEDDVYEDEETDEEIILKMSRKKVVLGLDPDTGVGNMCSISASLYNTVNNFNYEYTFAELTIESSDPTKVEVQKSGTNYQLQAVGGNYGDEVTITARYSNVNSTLGAGGLTEEEILAKRASCIVRIGNFIPVPELDLTTEGYHLAFIPQTPKQYLESLGENQTINIRKGNTDYRYYTFYKVEGGEATFLCGPSESDSFRSFLSLTADSSQFYNYYYQFENVKKNVEVDGNFSIQNIKIDEVIGYHLLKVEFQGFNKGTESNPKDVSEFFLPYELTGNIKYHVNDWDNDINTIENIFSRTFNIATF